jgi:peptidoglycan/LPS O-acetylase OafA/YrhL
VDDDNRRRSSLLKSQNITALDHLRGFAALLALFYHDVFGIYYSLTTPPPPVLAYTDEMLPKADFFLSAFVYEGDSGAA